MRIKALLSSTATRLSMLFLALFLITALALSFYVSSFSVRLVQTQTRAAIEQQITALNGAFERGGIPGLIRFVDRQARQPGAHLYLIADKAGRILSGNVMAIEPGVLDRPDWVMRPFTYERFAEGGEEEYRAIARVIRLPNGLTLLVGRDIGEPERVRGMVRQALTLALGMMTLGALLIWLLVGRRALNRIDAVSSESSRIIAGDLTRRLPVNGSGDEFDRLAESLNSLLDRISKLDVGVRDVANNVAHDLRTPLTRLRTRADHALSSSRNAKELRAALEGCVSESDRLIRTFNAILTISRLEAGAKLDNRQTAAVAPIINDVVELYEPTAEEAAATLEAETVADAEAPVHRELIAQALSNLIENALRHGLAEKDAKVTVSAALQPDATLAITVADNGKGVPAERLGDISGRFVRLEESRSSEGSGLGLSLVKAIAEAHGGRLVLADNAPGLKATIILPDARPAGKETAAAR